MEAKAASVAMQTAWQDVLRGQPNGAVVAATLRRVQTQIRAVLR